MTDDLEAGPFSPWLAEMAGALRGDNAAAVPCQGCTACCTSSQFIAIGPDETAALARIPAELLFPAPRRPGHLVLGYDERGHCPMLVDSRCSIYDDRPRTCRTYDCRVFPAAGVEVDEAQELIGRQAGRWRFGFPAPGDRERSDAVRAAARFLQSHGDLAPNPTVRAGLAVEIHELFLGQDPDAEVVWAAVLRLTAR